MQVQSMFFKKAASAKLGDALLQANMKHAKGRLVDGRAKVVGEIENWEAIRTHAAALRDRTIANLDAYLVEFEANATRRGAKVHWAESAEEACDILAEIARANGVKKVAKSKSMVSEEVNLNERLIARRRRSGRDRPRRIHPAARRTSRRRTSSRPPCTSRRSRSRTCS